MVLKYLDMACGLMIEREDSINQVSFWMGRHRRDFVFRGYGFAEPVFGGWSGNEKIVVGSDRQRNIFMANDAEIWVGRGCPP